MTKQTAWLIVAAIYIGAIIFGYFFVCDRFLQAQVPPQEVKIVHTYEEGYYKGYERGKAQAIEDVACIIH